MMKTARIRTYSPYTQEAVALLGKLIRRYRLERRWSTHDMANRLGISRTTLYKIESGDLKCEVGLVFEAAALTGVMLFEEQTKRLTQLKETVMDKIALLPQSIRKLKKDIDDDF